MPPIVPAVWPGSRYKVTVLPPSVIFMPSVAIMSRLGLPVGKPLTDSSTKSQSPAPMTIRTITLLHQFRPADFILMGMGNDDVFHLRRIEPKFFHAADNDVLRVIHAMGVVAV